MRSIIEIIVGLIFIIICLFVLLKPQEKVYADISGQYNRIIKIDSFNINMKTILIVKDIKYGREYMIVSGKTGVAISKME